MARKPRNYLGEAVVRLPKPIKKHVKPLVQRGQKRSVKGKEEFGKRMSRLVWGKKKR